jgi:hypothetical protein
MKNSHKLESYVSILLFAESIFFRKNEMPDIELIYRHKQLVLIKVYLLKIFSG